MSALANLRRFLREAKYNLSGRRVGELRADLAELTTNIAELTTNIAGLRAELGSRDFPIHESLSRLEEEPSPESEMRLAVISCMPPARTGIATATLLTFLQSHFPVDIFSYFESPEDYLYAITDRRLHGTNVRIFHLATLPFALRRTNYKAQLFVLGNSLHNFPLYSQLLRKVQFPALLPTFIHLHDPCMLNLLRMRCLAQEADFGAVIQRHYDVRPSNVLDDNVLVGAGIFGVRPLLQNIQVKGIFVNSLAALSIVKRECPNIPADLLFHPVFPMVEKTKRLGSAEFQIGTFGEPHHGKLTELVTEAFEIIKSRGHQSRLFIAGFGADRYAIANNLTRHAGYEIYDDVDDEQLCHLMQSIDVAVQLRYINLGETSGIVSRLINTDIPIIASDIGSFKEFADSVVFFDREGSSEKLADLIISLRGRPVNRNARQNFISKHTSQLFCRELVDVLTRTLEAHK